MELQEAFANLLKVIPSSTTRGSAFNVDFEGESEEDISIAAEVQKGRGVTERVQVVIIYSEVDIIKLCT